jgi:ribonuclease HI
MQKDEALIRLKTISEMIDDTLNNNQPMLVSTENLLESIQAIALGIETTTSIKKEVFTQKNLTISCYASINKETTPNIVSIGVVATWPKKESMPSLSFERLMPKSNTHIQGEYDAIYTGLSSIVNLHHTNRKLEIHSTNKTVIDQLNRKIKCKDKELQRRRDIILELVQTLQQQVEFIWKPKGSTPALKRANQLAQYVPAV